MFTNLPVTKATNTQHTNSIDNDRFMSCFLIGVIYANASFNYRHKRIVVNLPLSKSELTAQLKQYFGGSSFCYINKKSKITYTRWELSSKKGLAKLLKAVNENSDRLPTTTVDILTGMLS